MGTCLDDGFAKGTAGDLRGTCSAGTDGVPGAVIKAVPSIATHDPPRPHRAPSPRADRHRHRLLRVWLASTAVLFVVGALWSVATPVGAAPDEPTQIVKAAAVVRGELTGRATRHRSTAVVLVRVPQSFAGDGDLATCYAGRDTVPAGCAPHLSGKRRLVEAATYVGRYPPLYYLLVGAPTLLWTTNVAVYAMRLLSVLWSALLLGLAFAVAATFSRRRLLVGALAVAVSPLVIFLSSVVNPSGLEITAAVATWTTGLVLFLEHRKRPPPVLIAACTGSACVLVLCRGLSALWLALIALTLIALAPEAVRQLWRCRAVRGSAVGITALSVAAVIFVLHAKSLSVLPVGKPLPPHTAGFAVFVAALGRTGALLHQAVGVFGWLDTPSPVGVVLGWWLAVGLMVVIGLVVARRRQAAVLIGLLGTAVLLPTAIIASHAHSDGLVWQARDGMPLYVGIPLVGAMIAGETDPPDFDGLGAWSAPRAGDRLLVLLVVGVVTAQLVDFAWALRRYTVGLGTTLDPLVRVRGGWVPPVPTLALLLAGVAACTTYGWWLHRLTLKAGLGVVDPVPTRTWTAASTATSGFEDAAGDPVLDAGLAPASRRDATATGDPHELEPAGTRTQVASPTTTVDSAPPLADASRSSVDVGAILASVMAGSPCKAQPLLEARLRS